MHTPIANIRDNNIFLMSNLPLLLNKWFNPTWDRSI